MENQITQPAAPAQDSSTTPSSNNPQTPPPTNNSRHVLKIVIGLILLLMGSAQIFLSIILFFVVPQLKELQDSLEITQPFTFYLAYTGLVIMAILGSISLTLGFMLLKQKINLKKAIFLLIAIYLLQSVMIGFIIFSIITPIYKTISAIDSNLVTTSPIKNQIINPNTDMLAYENTTYGFSATYPKDWTILPSSQDNNVTFSGPPTGSGEASKPALVSIQVLETAKLQPGWEQNYATSPFSSNTLTNGAYTYYVTANTYTLGGQPSEETKKLAIDTMNQILSTFKFTNSSITNTPDVTSGWDTTSNNYFSIKYPTALTDRFKKCGNSIYYLAGSTLVNSTDTIDCSQTINIDSSLTVIVPKPSDPTNWELPENCGTIKTQNITIDTVPAVLKVYTPKMPLSDSCQFGDIARTIFSHNGKKYIISYNPQNMSAETFNQVISTFKFTN